MGKIDNLFILMNKKGIKAKKLSDDTGISTGNISDWKIGRSMPSADKLSILADYFNVSVDYLLGREKNERGYTMKNDNPNDFYLIYNDALCYRIGVLCHAKKLSVSDMIIKCDFKMDFVTYLKNLNKPLPLSILEKIALYLNISVDELLSDTFLFDKEKKEFVSLNDFPYLENFDNSSLAKQIRQYAEKQNIYGKYKLLEQIKEFMTKSLYTTLNSSSNNDIGEIAAWGAEGTKGTYYPPEEETT